MKLTIAILIFLIAIGVAVSNKKADIFSINEDLYNQAREICNSQSEITDLKLHYESNRYLEYSFLANGTHTGYVEFAKNRYSRSSCRINWK